MLKYLTATGTIVLVAAASLEAQTRSTVSASELDGVVASRTAERTGNRETVRKFLETDAARTAAARLGATSEDLSARVGTLDESTVSSLADRIRANDLAGGANVVISTTLIIIVLLVVILIAVA